MSQLKKLKEYGIEFKQLKSVCKALNGTELADPIKLVGLKGEKMLYAFMVGIYSLPDNKTKKLPDEVKEFYKDIVEEVTADIDDDDDNFPSKSKKKKKEPAPEKPKETEPDPEPETDDAEGDDETGDDAGDDETGDDDDSCPDFGDFNADDDECVKCEKNYPDEYAACVEKTQAKEKAKEKAKATKAAPKAGKRTRYGHMPGSMSGAIDDMMYNGATKDEVVQNLMEKFDRTEAKAKGKFTAHMKRLVNQLELTVKEKKDGTLKIKEKYIEGRSADNTLPGLPE